MFTLVSVHSEVPGFYFVIFFSLLPRICIFLQNLCHAGVKFREECFTLVPMLFSCNMLISVFLKLDMENEGTRSSWRLPVFIIIGVESITISCFELLVI